MDNVLAPTFHGSTTNRVALGTKLVIAHASQVRLKIARSLAHLIRHLTLIQLEGFQAAYDSLSILNSPHSWTSASGSQAVTWGFSFFWH